MPQRGSDTNLKSLSILLFCLILFGNTISISAVHYPDTRIIPGGLGLDPVGGYLYTVGYDTISRLNRGSSEFETVFKGSSNIYRFAADQTGHRIIAGYELDRKPVLFDIRLKSEIRLPKIEDMYLYEYIYFSRREENAVIYVSYNKDYQYHGFRVATVALAPPYRQTVQTFPRADILFANAHSVVFATLNNKVGFPSNASWYRQIKAVDLESGQSEILFDFETSKGKINPRAKLLRLTRAAGETVAFYVNKGQVAEDGWLIRYDTTTKKLYKNRYPLNLPPDRGSAMSEKSNRFVLFVNAGEQAWVVLYDFIADLQSVIELTPILAGKKAHLLGNGNMFRAGTLADNATIWLHWGDALLLIYTNGTFKIHALRRYTAIPSGNRIEWAGASYFFSNPDQFYLGIEQNGGRYFIKIDLKKLEAL